MRGVKVITLRISIKLFFKPANLLLCRLSIFNRVYRIHHEATQHNRHSPWAYNRFIKQGINGCGIVISGIDVDFGADSKAFAKSCYRIL